MGESERLLSRARRIHCFTFMKSHVFTAVWVAMLLGGCATQDKNQIAAHQTPYQKPLASPGAKFGALPTAVQRTVLAQVGEEEVVDAVRDTSSGRVIYKIYFRDSVGYPPMYVAPDGSVLNPDLTVAVSAGLGTRVKPADVPPKVMKVIPEHAPSSGCLYQQGNLGWARRLCRQLQRRGAQSEAAHRGRWNASWTRLSSLSPDAQFFELPRRYGLPIAVRRRTGWAWMQNPADLQGASREHVPRPFGGKVADPDHPFGLQGRDDGSQMPVAHGKQGCLFRGRQFVGRAIAAAALQESQGAIVQHDMLRKESPRRPESRREEAP